jgi:DNA-binding protein YbaB
VARPIRKTTHRNASRALPGPAAPLAPDASAPGDVTAADQQRPHDIVGERTARQASMIPGFAGMPGMSQFLSPFLGGGAVVLGGLSSGTSAQWLHEAMGDPYAFGRWVGQFYWGSYSTYRLILAHPRIRQARATLTKAIEAGSWEVEADDDVPERITRYVTDNFTKLRAQYVPDAIRALDLGWAPFETVWDLRDGFYAPTRLKPLLPDITTIRVDEFGNYAGVQQGSNPNGNGNDDHPTGGWLDTWKSHIYSFDVECGNLYGRPLTENARQTAWRLWLDAAFQLHGIGEKLSEVIAMGFAPAGSFPDSAGNTVTPVDEMKKAMAGLKDTGMAVFTNLTALSRPGMSPDQLRKLSESSMSSLEFYDAGNHSAAISGKLEQMKHAEDLMFAAYLVSSRTGMQAEHGSRADSEQHSDTGLIVSEAIDRDIAENLSRTVLNQALELNFGERWRDKVRLRATPLVDRKAEMFEDLMVAALKDPVVGPAISGTLDWDSIAKRSGVPTVEGVKLSDLVTAAVEDAKRQKDEAAKAAQDAARNPQPVQGGGAVKEAA